MITHVNHVLVGTQFNLAATTIDSAAIGDVLILDQDGNLAVNAGAIAAGTTAIQFGVVRSKEDVYLPDGTLQAAKSILELGMPIQKNPLKSMTITWSDYIAPVQEVATLGTTATFTPVVDRQYVLRILYKDLAATSAGRQFTHTYYAIADTTNALDLYTKFAAQINRDLGRSRVTATASATALTLTARQIVTDNNIDEYSIVRFVASLYQTTETNPLLTWEYTAIPGMEFTITTEPFEGMGYWEQVRDLERRNRGYKGFVFRGAYPRMYGRMNYTPNMEYDTLTIEYDNLYRSNDNQYIKDTPLVTNVFVTNPNGTQTAADAIADWAEVVAAEFTL